MGSRDRGRWQRRRVRRRRCRRGWDDERSGVVRPSRRSRCRQANTGFQSHLASEGGLMAEDGGRRGAESRGGGRVALSRCHEKDVSAVVPSQSASQATAKVRAEDANATPVHSWAALGCIFGKALLGGDLLRSAACWRCWSRLSLAGSWVEGVSFPQHATAHAPTTTPPQMPTDSALRTGFRSLRSKIQAALYFPAGVLPDTASLSNCHQKRRNPRA